MKERLSVIICTHNPRMDYLQRVLDALDAQTLPKDQWELLLIDNASEKSVASIVNLEWHPNSRHIREEQLGLTNARLRGIKESVAETLVFVDDDNILDSDYLEVALRISNEYPFLGAWGGQIRPDFEIKPPEWTRKYWPILAIREFDQDKWSNLLHQYETTPCGAGACIRRSVGEYYAKLLASRVGQVDLDRKGDQLTSCGDMDLAFTACDIGLGTGQFKDLKMTHIIPAFRLQADYLAKLSEGIGYSGTMLISFRGQLPTNMSWLKKLYYRWRLSPRHRRIYDASERGSRKALKEIKLDYNKETGR